MYKHRNLGIGSAYMTFDITQLVLKFHLPIVHCRVVNHGYVNTIHLSTLKVGLTE
jgi:hypothetical protein